MIIGHKGGPVVGRWRVTVSYGPDWHRLGAPWRQLTVAVVKFRRMPAEAAVPARDDYAGVVIRGRVLLPVSLQVDYGTRHAVRWALAELLNRSPRTCWSSIVGWAMRSRGDRKARANGIRTVFDGDRCRAESAVHRDRTCYCGKFADGKIREGDAS